MAILDSHVVGNLPANSVAVVVAGRHAANDDAIAILQKDATRMVAVQIVIVLLVAIEREIFDDHVTNIFTTEDRIQRGARAVAHEPEIFAQRPVELEAVSVASHQRPFEHLFPAIARVFCPQAHAVANAKAAWLDERDLLIEPIAVGRKFGGLRWLFHEHAIEPTTENPHFGRKVDCVSQAISTGQDVNGPAAQWPYIIDRCLEDLLVGSNEIRLPWAGRDDHARFPIGLDSLIAGCCPWPGDRRTFGRERTTGEHSRADGGHRTQKQATARKRMMVLPHMIRLLVRWV